MRIYTQWVLPGVHRFPGHLTLGPPHYHTFDFLVTVEVHGDRQVEFLAFRERIKNSLLSRFKIVCRTKEEDILDFDTLSCESLSIITAEYVRVDLIPMGFTNESIKVCVAEQDEFSGVYYETTLDKVEADYQALVTKVEA